MANWRRKFPLPIPARGGDLVTLADARTFILNLPGYSTGSPAWDRAIEALMAAANGKGSLKTAREKVHFALFLHMMIDFDRAAKDRK